MKAITPQDAVRAATESLGGLVSVADGLVRAGRSVDLAGLERDATALCVAAMALPPAEGRALRGDLAVLMAGVDTLIGRLRR